MKKPKKKRKKKTRLIGFRGEGPSYHQRLQAGFKLLRAAYRVEED